MKTLLLERIGKTSQSFLHVIEDSGHDAPDTALVMFSYMIPVALYHGGKWVRTREHYSRTTTQHIHKVCGKTAKAVTQDELNKRIHTLLQSLSIPKEAVDLFSFPTLT